MKKLGVLVEVRKQFLNSKRRVDELQDCLNYLVSSCTRIDKQNGAAILMLHSSETDGLVFYSPPLLNAVSKTNDLITLLNSSIKALSFDLLKRKINYPKQKMNSELRSAHGAREGFQRKLKIKSSYSNFGA